jgi:hypothetical protein
MPSSPTAAPDTGTPVLPQGTLLLMATACGLCAGANSYPPPLLHPIAVDLGISAARAARTRTQAPGGEEGRAAWGGRG